MNGHPRGWVLALAVAGTIAITSLAASSVNAIQTPAGLPQVKQGSGLRFGIYPGGGIGSVNDILAPRPEDPVKRLAALTALSSSSPFVIHLYSAYTGNGPTRSDLSWLDEEIAQYTDVGFAVELVARYRPEKGAAGPVAGFSNYVRNLVERYGGNPRFVSLQVTNEANLGGSGDSSDGAYGSAIPALVQAVIAGADEVRASDAKQLKIGFNWAYEASGKKRRRFWNRLAVAGGKDFAGAVDWVGLNSYPGTWTPLRKGVKPRRKSAGRTLVTHIRTLRNRLMPRARLGPGVPINVTENGWPTGPGRSKARQARVVRSMVSSVARARRRLNITDYRWFDLRDSRSSDSNFESRYGLTDDLYRPKPAFFVFRKQIARWSARPIELPDLKR